MSVLCWKEDANKQMHQMLRSKIRAAVVEGKTLPCLTADIMPNRLSKVKEQIRPQDSISVSHVLSCIF